MSDDILLSPKHGVNPSLLICPLCGQDTGVALCGRLKGDIAAPQRMLDVQPCRKCQTDLLAATQLGFVLIVVTEEPVQGASPWPNFVAWHCVTEAGMDRLLPDWRVRFPARRAFVTTTIAQQIGIPMQPPEET